VLDLGVLNVFFQAGNYMRDDMVSCTIQLVSSCGDTSLQARAARRLWSALSSGLAAEKQPLAQCAAWIIGEYGDLLIDTALADDEGLHHINLADKINLYNERSTFR